MYEKLGDIIEFHRTLAMIESKYEEHIEETPLSLEDPLINNCGAGEHELEIDLDGDVTCVLCDYMPTPAETLYEVYGE